jgi:carnitine-CoA ligase
VHDYRFEERVLPFVLEDKARRHGDELLVTGDAELSYRQAADLAARLAGGLAARGVGPGDRVLTMLPNTLHAVVSFLGIAWHGAVGVPVNTAYRGDILRYILTDADASLLIIHTDFLETFLQVAPEVPSLRTVVVCGDDVPTPEGFTVSSWAELLDAEPTARAELHPGDLQAIMYTSGTTGPSKGVMVPYHLAYQYANPNGSHFQLDGDVVLVTLPLFHIGGQWQGIYAAMLADGCAVLRKKFSVSNFWADVDQFGVTSTTLLGVMAEFLWKQPERPDDATHSLARVTMAPALRDGDAFAKRFGCRVGTGWGLTEVGAVTLPPAQDEPPQETHLCGKVRAEMYEIVLVDEHDRPVPVGTPGQALVRPVEPYALMLGYWRKPEATVAAWRNLWFHTGDVLVQNPDGSFVYLDRIKDSIRRRGENISSLEVEQGVLAHPDVNEVAAFGVQTDHAEDEVMVVVSLLPDRFLTAEDLHAWLEPRMPAFMVPRYIEITGDLPKTPTSKIKKDVLRKDGVQPTTWDHQAQSSGATR